MKAHLAILLLFICCLKKTFAQTKFEKEYRINKEEVPKSALNFIDAAAFTSKIKWYKEEALASYSYEAKTTAQGIKYSIEFDSLGRIEDVEYKIAWKSVPPMAKAKMELFFDRTFQKWKIVKVQVHHTGSAQRLIDFIKKKETTLKIVTKYELVVKGKIGKQSQLIEYLFSGEGILERTSVIVLKNSDHLEY